MSTTETLSGTVVFLLRREGQDPVILEFELQLDDGTRRVVRTVTDNATRLREGDAVVVTGRTDAETILVAHTITPQVPPAPPPAPAPKRRLPWIWLSVPPIALVTQGIIYFAIESADLADTYPFVLAGVAVMLLAPINGAGRRRKIILRVIGASMILCGFVYGAGGQAPGITAIVLVFLSVVALIAAIILLFVASAWKAADLARRV